MTTPPDLDAISTNLARKIAGWCGLDDPDKTQSPETEVQIDELDSLIRTELQPLISALRHQQAVVSLYQAIRLQGSLDSPATYEKRIAQLETQLRCLKIWMEARPSAFKSQIEDIDWTLAGQPAALAAQAGKGQSNEG